MNASHGQRGQAVIELAVSMTLLFVLLIGVIDIGHFTEFDTELASGARAGTQFGSASKANAMNTAGMTAAASADDPGIAAWSFSYYKCEDGTPPTTTLTSPPKSMAATAGITCPASQPKQLYVVVITQKTYRPTFRFFGLGVTHKRMAVMQAPAG